MKKSTKKLLSEYLEYINEANGDDVIKYPGEARDIDLYSEDSLGSIPSCGEEEFEIEISDEPLPDSYWLMIGDRYFHIYDVMLITPSSADSYVLQKDVTSKYATHRLEVHTLSFQEFR